MRIAKQSSLLIRLIQNVVQNIFLVADFIPSEKIFGLAGYEHRNNDRQHSGLRSAEYAASGGEIAFYPHFFSIQQRREPASHGARKIAKHGFMRVLYPYGVWIAQMCPLSFQENHIVRLGGRNAIIDSCGVSVDFPEQGLWELNSRVNGSHGSFFV